LDANIFNPPYDPNPPAIGAADFPEPVKVIPINFNEKGAVSMLGTSLGPRSSPLTMLKKQFPELLALRICSGKALGCMKF